MKTSELTGPALDWAVAKCEGVDAEILTYPTMVVLADKDAFGTRRVLDPLDGHDNRYSPSTNWSQGGPIVEREKIGVWYDKHSYKACLPKPNTLQEGPTPLIAALRCYVASKFGDEVEIPEELK